MATYTEEPTYMTSNNKSPVEKLLPALPFVLGGMSFLFMLLKTMRKGDARGFKSHHHEAMEHSHAHVHVTHNLADSDASKGGWEHLTAEHEHPHNHTATDHSHRPHRNFDKEHAQEAHVHDHEHPTHS
jgi:hypothetical protein